MCASWQVLRRNPELPKGLVVAGLLVCIMFVPSPYVVSELQSEIWDKEYASKLATVNMLAAFAGISLGGCFGRVSDQCGSRAALAIATLLISLPVYVLLIAGLNSLGLILWSAARVLGGITCMTFSGCPALYTLIEEILRPEDREVGFGLVFAGVCIIYLIIMVSMQAVKHSEQAVLFSTAAMSVIGFLMIALIRIPDPEQVSSEISKTPGEDDIEHGTTKASQETTGGTSEPCAIIAPLRFAMCSHTLRNLCLIMALISTSETVLLDLILPYAYSSFDISGGADRAEQQHVSILLLYFGPIGVALACHAAGLAAKRFSARAVLLCSIPAVALIQLLPVLLRFYPEYWLLPFTGLAVQLAIALFPAVQILVAATTPKERMGEAMGAVGAFKSLAALFGNFFVAAGAPALQLTHLSKPFWIFFPVGSVMTLCALIFAFQLKSLASESSQPSPSAGELET